jgi:phosphoglucosamine mutase
MQKKGAVIGGEQSGHIILYDDGHVAGDGLYTALRVIEVMLSTGKTLSDLCSGIRKFPQTIVNLKVKSKPPMSKLVALNKAHRDIAKRLNGRGRVNIRYSGTEPLLRIMVEAEDQPTLDAVAKELTAAARKDLS